MQNKKSKAMFLSIIPGAGHMYLGLLNQGIQLMFTFFLTTYLSNLLDIGLFKILATIIWFYSIFDVRRKACMEEIPQDSSRTLFSYMDSNSTNKIIGYVLIFVGAVSILDKIFMPYISEILTYEVRGYLRTGFASIVLIGLGLYLLSKSDIKNITRGGDR